MNDFTKEDLELKNIVAAMICVTFPDAVKKFAEAYNEISCSILDTLMKHNISDDKGIEEIIQKVLMHAISEGMPETYTDFESNDAEISKKYNNG